LQWDSNTKEKKMTVISQQGVTCSKTIQSITTRIPQVLGIRMEDHFVESRAMPILIATAMAQLTTTTGMMVAFANVRVATAEMIVRLRHRGKQQPRFQMATPQKLYVVALTMSSSNGAGRGNPH
jgi:hypothetical protein